MSLLEGAPPELEPEDTPTGGVDVATASATVAFWTLVSRATGFVRVAVVAAALGATYLGNVYGATNYLPNLALELITGSVLASLLVPSLVRSLDAGGRRAAEHLAGAYLGLVLLVFTAFAAAVALAGPLLLGLFTAGVSDRTVASDQLHVGWILLALQVWQIPLYAVVQVGTAAQTASGRFAIAAAAPAIENIGIIVVMGLYVALYSNDATVSNIGAAQMLLLGLGSTGAVAAHAAVQWWGARRGGITLRPRRGDWRSPELRALFTRARLAFRLSALTATRTFGALAVANTVAGGVVAFQVGLNFLWLPSALGARPVAVALQPLLSRLHQRGDERRFRAEFVRGLAIVLFMAIPAAVGYVVLSKPLAHVVAYGQFHTQAGLDLLVAAIAGLGLGVVGESTYTLSTYGSFARDDARSPYRAMVVGAVVAALGMALAVIFFHGSTRLFALGVAYSASTTVAAWRLARFVGRADPGAEPFGLGRAAMRILACSAVMAVPAYLLAAELTGTDATRGAQIVGLALAGVVGIAVYVGVQRLWRAPELGFFRDALPRRR